jgi:hypothetical protein
MVFLDKHGWPVERIKGRYVKNFIRLLILSRSVIADKEWKRRENIRVSRMGECGIQQSP